MRPLACLLVFSKITRRDFTKKRQCLSNNYVINLCVAQNDVRHTSYSFTDSQIPATTFTDVYNVYTSVNVVAVVAVVYVVTQ